ncbi:RabGAP/TBC [Backusella circina FSU 941]|nr:RabGAP/TBC [Backusella circina FSU 941]
MQLNRGRDETTIIPLKTISTIYVCPPSDTRQGSIGITSVEGVNFKPIWYSAALNNTQLDISTWPGYDITDILAAFNPLQSSLDTPHLYLVTENIQNDASSDHSTQSTVLDRLSIAQPILPLLPTHMQQFYLNKTVRNTCNEYQMASEYLTRWIKVTSNREDQACVDALLSVLPELTGPLPDHTRAPEDHPIQPEEWVFLFDNAGRLKYPVEHVKQLIFRGGGLHPDIRIEAWKFLLGIYPWDSSSEERLALRQSNRAAYYQIKGIWFNNVETRDSEHFKDERFRIAKDVHRTDRTQEMLAGEDLPNPDQDIDQGTNENLETMKEILVSYNYYNTELGYVQGMSDLLAPLYVAMGDEAMAFWVFAKFMDRMKYNFLMDQTGMHGQLSTLSNLVQFMDPVLFKRLEEANSTNMFFSFRWLLVWFKREFEWQDVIRLWEILWTDWLSDRMIVFVALAVIDEQREKILNEFEQCDEIYQYMNDLSGKISLETTLQRTEVLFYQFQRKVRMMQHTRSMLKEQLDQRSRWSGLQRANIERRVELLSIPDNLF